MISSLSILPIIVGVYHNTSFSFSPLSFNFMYFVILTAKKLICATQMRVEVNNL